MRKNKTYIFRKFRHLFLTAALLVAGNSCTSIHEDILPCEVPPCEVSLEFVFDYNMEYTDSFSQQVNAVDVFLFDGDEKLVWCQRAETDELAGRKRMTLPANLAPGAYKVLTVGALCEKFLMSTHDGVDCNVGTTLDEIRLSLVRESQSVAHEFPHLWFTKEAADIVVPRHITQNMVWPVHLVRETNKFNFVIVDANGSSRSGGVSPLSAAPYTFEVVTPEGAAYSWKNEPLDMVTPVTYAPYSLYPGTGANLSVAKLNTVRLFTDYQYQLVIKETATSNIVFQYDFMDILETLNIGSDGQPLMPHQEFLDRKGEWDIVVFIRQGERGGLQFGLFIEVLDWIVWYSEMGV